MAYDDEKGGRPPVYDPEYHPDAAFELIAKSGANEATLARIFKVDRSAIYLWKVRHKEFVNKYEEAWDVWNCNKIEKTLVKKAEGYRYIEKTEVINPDTRKKTSVTKYHKVAQPDIQAIKTLLNSRRPNRYQDKQHVEHEGNITVQTVDYAKAEEEDS